MQALNFVLYQCILWMLRLRKRDAEPWADFRRRGFLQARQLVVMHLEQRWSTRWLCRWWGYQGHLARNGNTHHPLCSAIRCSYRPLKWWQKPPPQGLDTRAGSTRNFTPLLDARMNEAAGWWELEGGCFKQGGLETTYPKMESKQRHPMGKWTAVRSLVVITRYIKFTDDCVPRVCLIAEPFLAALHSTQHWKFLVPDAPTRMRVFMPCFLLLWPVTDQVKFYPFDSLDEGLNRDDVQGPGPLCPELSHATPLDPSSAQCKMPPALPTTTRF